MSKENKIDFEYHTEMSSAALQSIRTVIHRYQKQVYDETGVFIDDFDFLIRTDLLHLKKIDDDHYSIDSEKILNMPPDDIWQLMIEFAVDKKRIGKNKIKEIENTRQPDEEYTHRHYAIAEWYKWTAELIDKPTVKQLHAQGKKAREKAFNSLNKQSPTYKPIRQDELKKAIELLAEYPPAKKLAESHLEK